MSQTTSIDIKQADIITRVSKLSHYKAVKTSAEGATFERIATIDANKELLSDYFKQATSALVNHLRRWIDEHPASADSTYTELKFNIVLPQGADPMQLPNLQPACEDYLTAMVASEWFRMLDMTDVSQSYIADAEAAFTRLDSAIYSRRLHKRWHENETTTNS